MKIYKLSIVVSDQRGVGGIQNLDKKPSTGDILTMGRSSKKYRIITLNELMPPRGNFIYLHATCETIDD